MKVKLVSWNVRGLNSRDKRRFVKSQIFNWKADIVCLQESKLEREIQYMIKEIWGGRWVKYACLQASGTKGGILMIWDSRSCRCEVLEVGSYTLTCKFEARLQDFNCHITGVYAKNCRLKRKYVWDEIGAIRSLFEGPWVVCGDSIRQDFLLKREIVGGEHQLW
ncbi:unnamed protein product [Withania somnifera]